jgi:dipeptidase
MCDTIVALGNATADSSVIFAKNSDREPNEAHQLLIIPAARHPEGSTVRCTYIEIPQVSETYALLLAKPFWIWGAEMGANSEGVVIGNEAVFTRVPQEKAPGLIGMDFIRLALERAATAWAALEVMIGLLETYGQGGNCGFNHPFYYHNSYILADPREAWVLETAGRQWAAQRVTSVRSISNSITIGNDWDLASDGLVDYALEQGWCKNREDFDFGRCYSDRLYTRFSDARARCTRTTDLLHNHRGRITVETMMSYLRDHGANPEPGWSPGRALSGADVCMHVGFGPIRINQTVGSMVSHLTPDQKTHWLTGTSAPCTGVFKPVWLDSGLPEVGLSPQGAYDAACLWWNHETLHREVVRDYAVRLPLYKAERDELERKFIGDWEETRHAGVQPRAAFTAGCFKEAGQATERWIERVRSVPVQNRSEVLYALAWRNFNKQAGLPAGG